jgi:hypothetical protein
MSSKCGWGGSWRGTIIEVVATDELAEGLISVGVALPAVITTVPDTRGTLPLASIGSLRVPCTPASKGVLSSGRSSAFGMSTGGRDSTTLYPEPRSFSQNIPFHTRLGRLRTISSGARSRRAARAARARWTRSVQRVSRDGRVRTMRKDRMGLGKEHQLPRAITGIRSATGMRPAVEEGQHDRIAHTCTTPKEVRQPAAWRQF